MIDSNSEESSSRIIASFLRVFSPQIHCHGSFIFMAIGNIVNVVSSFKKSQFLRVLVKTVNYWKYIAPFFYAIRRRKVSRSIEEICLSLPSPLAFIDFLRQALRNRTCREIFFFESFVIPDETGEKMVYILNEI